MTTVVTVDPHPAREDLVAEVVITMFTKPEGATERVVTLKNGVKQQFSVYPGQEVKVRERSTNAEIDASKSAAEHIDEITSGAEKKEG